MPRLRERYLTQTSTTWRGEAGERSLKIDNVEIAIHAGAGNHHHVHVMAEQDWLYLLANDCQRCQGVSGASIVKGCEDVITDKRRGALWLA